MIESFFLLVVKTLKDCCSSFGLIFDNGSLIITSVISNESTLLYEFPNKTLEWDVD